jgi:hypothetical protein
LKQSFEFWPGPDFGKFLGRERAGGGFLFWSVAKVSWGSGRMGLMRYRLRTLMIAIAAVGIGLAVLREAGRAIKPSIIYSFRADFAEMPPDDAELTDWLRNQPGVIRRTVAVNREPSAIRVHWIMSRDLFGNPPTPDCQQQFNRLGYKGLKTSQRGI